MMKQPGTRWRKLARLAGASFLVVTANAVALAQATDARTADVLRRAMRYQVQFRAGRMDIIPEYVAMLEEATKADPENAELWNAMSVAYLAQGASPRRSYLHDPQSIIPNQ